MANVSKSFFSSTTYLNRSTNLEKTLLSRKVQAASEFHTTETSRQAHKSVDHILRKLFTLIARIFR